MEPINIIIALAALALGGAGAYFWPKSKNTSSDLDPAEKIKEAQSKAKQIKETAQNEIKRREKLLTEEEKETSEREERSEEVLTQKEAVLSRREEKVHQVKDQETLCSREIEETKAKIKERKENLEEELILKGGLSRSEALEELTKDLNLLVQKNAEQRKQTYLESFEEDLVRRAKEILQIAMQRLEVRSSVDKNSTAVEIQDEKFKGMLIGKDGKNITYLESLLPIAVIFNMPDLKTIYVGGVNLIRRNIAKGAIERMQKLVKKGQILDHQMIQSTVQESEAEIMKICDERGAKALRAMQLDPATTDPELVNYVGRLYYRTSYGQNIIYHSLEMAYLARLIADLSGADVNIAMQAAFYHDIGKAIDHDIGGVAHDDLSKEILEKHDYDPRIVHAAYAHHDKVPCIDPEDFLVKAVDALSGGRPGARLESVTNYFERMKQLEETALGFDGVEKVLTMSAGREVRVRVRTEQISDDTMQPLADQIAKKITEDLSFPGIIKVNLQRITRFTDYANTDGGKRPKAKRG